MRREAERLQAVAEQAASKAIEKEAVRHTRAFAAGVRAQAQIDVSALLHDDDLANLISIRSEQFNGLIRSLSDDILNRIERETLGAIFEGRSNADIARAISAIDEIGRKRATLIARDQASKLNGAMNQFRQEQAGVRFYKWKTILDGRERPTHHANNGKVFAWAKAPATGHPGHEINCFPGSTKVDLTNGCYKLWRRFYQGPVVTVETGQGARLQATPNHPILTGRGWLAINDVQEGDYLIHVGKSRIVDDLDGRQLEASFAELFEAAQHAKGAKSAAMSASDFHGDGSDNEVYVVRPEPNLRNGFVSSIGEPTAQDVFAESHDAERGLTTGDTRGPGGCAESLPLVSISVRHAEDHRLASRSRGDASIPEAKGYPVSANPEFIGKRLDGSALSESINDGRVIDRLASPEVWPSGQRFAGCSHRDASIGKPRVDDRGGNTHIIRDLDGGLTANVPADNRVNINGDGSPWSILPGMRLSERTTRDARCFEAIENGPSVTAKILRDGPCRFPGTVTFNNVVSVNVGPFRGHVYNLHTASGHYVADGIIAHNCVMTFVLDTEEMP